MSGSGTHRGILVGVDRSASSMAAVKWAARDAAMRNVPLTLVHVVAPVASAAAPWPVIPVPQDYFQRQDDEARRILEDAPGRSRQHRRPWPAVRVQRGGTWPDRFHARQ